MAHGIFRDTPTATPDTRAELSVYESLRELVGGRTVVLITHRTASVRHAGWIYALCKGKTVTQGTHAVLVNAGGRWAEPYSLQARAYACDDPDSDAGVNNG